MEAAGEVGRALIGGRAGQPPWRRTTGSDSPLPCQPSCAREPTRTHHLLEPPADGFWPALHRGHDGW